MNKIVTSFLKLLALALILLASHSFVSAKNNAGTQLEALEIRIGTRIYSGTVWDTPKGIVPVNCPAGVLLEEHIASLPPEKQPLSRVLADGSEEPNVFDDGDCWVELVSPRRGRRIAYGLEWNGLHVNEMGADENEHPQNDVPGRDVIDRMPVKTVATNFNWVLEIAKQVAGSRKYDSFDAGYKSTDFVLDFVLRLVSPGDRTLLRENSVRWPKAMRWLDAYFYEKLGVSAFSARRIPTTKTTSAF